LKQRQLYFSCGTCVLELGVLLMRMCFHQGLLSRQTAVVVAGGFDLSGCFVGYKTKWLGFGTMSQQQMQLNPQQ
jgi:hypothetical protein